MEKYPFSNYGSYLPQSPKYPQSSPLLDKSTKRLFWILGAFVIIILGILSYFLFFSGEKTGEKIPNENNEGVLSLVSCEDWDCFIEASESCEESSFTDTKSIELFGTEITTTTYYEINKDQENNCITKFRTEEQHVSLTDEMVQQMLNQGISQEEIDQQEQKANEQADLLEGREGLCKISSDDLGVFLTKSKEGALSGGVSCSLTEEESECTYSGDWEFFNDCQGDYFSSEL